MANLWSFFFCIFRNFIWHVPPLKAGPRSRLRPEPPPKDGRVSAIRLRSLVLADAREEKRINQRREQKNPNAACASARHKKLWGVCSMPTAAVQSLPLPGRSCSWRCK